MTPSAADNTQLLEKYTLLYTYSNTDKVISIYMFETRDLISTLSDLLIRWLLSYIALNNIPTYIYRYHYQIGVYY